MCVQQPSRRKTRSLVPTIANNDLEDGGVLSGTIITSLLPDAEPFPPLRLTHLSTTNASVRSEDPCNLVPAYNKDLLG
jgi:hypothetical protein